MCEDRTWIRRTIAHQETEAVPYYFDFTPPAKRLIERHYGRPIAQKLAFPIRMTTPDSVKPLYAHPASFGEAVEDEFGVLWTASEVDRGCPIGPSLKEPSLSGYRFPDHAAPHRWEALSGHIERMREHFVIVWVGDLWERATFMRGMQNMLMDLVLHPRFVDELLSGIARYILGTMEILFERYAFDAIAVSDDYGAQGSMLMSPSAWRRFIRPHLAEIYAFAKDRDRYVLHHSDGHIYPIIGDLIDIGCDILHPVQPESMDVFALKREFGRHLTLWGGMRTQDLLVWGSPDEIRTEVEKLKGELGRGGGYIMSNGITIQADVPLENMIAMIEQARVPRSHP
jgi:uroporphyrinogen decarboxylase